MRKLITLVKHFISSNLGLPRETSMGISSRTLQDFEYKLTEVRKTVFLEKNIINTIIDIGASCGDFVELVKNTKPNACIYAFEPVVEVFDNLNLKFRGSKNIFLFNTAIGNIDGNIDFFQNEYTHSSSVLQIGEKHVNEFPFTKNFVKKNVLISRLDSIFKEINLAKPVLIKIDVQGYEQEVISGARKVLSIADFVIVEVSFFELYDNQPLFNCINNQLISLGFEFSGILHQLYSSDSSSILQADALYVKTEKHRT